VDERVEAGNTCVLNLGLSIPAIVDNMENTVGQVYSGMPARLYIVDKEGKIAYRGEKGSKEFKPLEMERALVKLLALSF